MSAEMRRRFTKAKTQHYAVFVNRAAGRYTAAGVKRLLDAIVKAGRKYTLYEPASAQELLTQARQAIRGPRSAGRPAGRRAPGYGRGKVTALISCGGDGTFNLVARCAVEANLPVGVLPMGKINNIARSLLPSLDVNKAIETILSGGYTHIDMARAADQPFFGSVGLGFVCELCRELQQSNLPRYGLGWSQLGHRVAEQVKPKKLVLKVDAFRFDISPILLNINLLPYSCGLPMTPVSLPDDGTAEVIFDDGSEAGSFSSFTRQIFKRKYLYGAEVKLYRGKVISIQMVKGRTLYLDGELITVPNAVIEIVQGGKQLKVFR